MKPSSGQRRMGLLALVIAGQMAGPAGRSDAAGMATETTQGYRDEVYRTSQPHAGPPRTGAQVYKDWCATCHDRTTQGAPLPDDDIEWRRRAGQGMAVLMRHVIDGYNALLMPPRGGCTDCSDAELKAAVVYIFERSGVEPPP